MKLRLLTLALMQCAILSACGSDGLSTQAPNTNNEPGGNTNSPFNMNLPRSVSQNDEGNLSSDNTPMTDNASNSKVADEGNSRTDDSADVALQIIEQKDALYTVDDSHVYPINALLIDTHLLEERAFFAEHQLAVIDQLWSQIESICSAINDKENCDIPAGTLELSDDEYGTAMYYTEADLSYIRHPSEQFDHQLSISETYDDEGSHTETFQWNNHRSLITVQASGDWHFDNQQGSFSSQLELTEGETGKEISLIEKHSDSESSHTLLMYVKELGGNLNEIEAKTQTGWEYANQSGSSTSITIANDNGGKLSTSSEFTDSNGQTEKHHSRTTFNAQGYPTAVEFCEALNGTDCTRPENWQTVSEEELIPAIDAAMPLPATPEELIHEDGLLIDLLPDSGYLSQQYEYGLDDMLQSLQYEVDYLGELELVEGFPDGKDYYEPTDSFYFPYNDGNLPDEIHAYEQYPKDEFSVITYPNEYHNEEAPEFITHQLDDCTDMGLPASECLFGEVLMIEGSHHPLQNLQESLYALCEALGLAREDCGAQVDSSKNQ